ncbi:MAG: YgeY family selenium metabolism-linked hydrolase [Veillonellales bacterium]
MFSKQREESVVALCQELIQKKSYSGQEDLMAAYLRQVFGKYGYDEILTDDYGNVIGHIRGNRSGKAILFDGHMDTVPVTDEDKWQYPPFSGELADGKIYGRGASDMKGAVSAMILGAAYFADDCRKDFAGDIYVAGVVHEECFEGVAARQISKMIRPDYVVIGEASELNLKRGQRGRAEIIVETEGKPAHSANPQAGINAVYKMAELINQIRTIETPHHAVLGEGILELTDIKSSPYPGASVVPDYCRVTYDRRLLVGETREDVIKTIVDLIHELHTKDPEFVANAYVSAGAERCYTGTVIEGERFFPAWLYEADDEFVQAAISGLCAVGLKPKLTQYSFCTNGSHYAGEAGIKTIGFGPSGEELAHTMDEYIEVDQLLKATAGYYGILKSVFQKG